MKPETRARILSFAIVGSIPATFLVAFLVLHELRVRGTSTLYESDRAIALYLGKYFVILVCGSIPLTILGIASDKWRARIRRKHAEQRESR